MIEKKSERNFSLQERTRKQKKYWDGVIKNYKKIPYFCQQDIKNENVYRLSVKYCEVESELSEQLTKQSMGNEISLFVILLSGLFVTINKYCNEDNITLAIPSYKSKENEYLFLQSRVVATTITKEFIRQVGNSVKEAFINQSYPIFKHRKDLESPFICCNYSSDSFYISQEIWLKGHLNFSFSYQNYQILYEISYDKTFFDERKIEIIKACFETILRGMSKCCNESLAKIELLSSEDKQKRFKLCYGETLLTKKHTIIEYLEKQFQIYPEQVILSDGTQNITYRELYERSNQLINFMYLRGIKKGDKVAILLERSVEYMIAITAIVRLGAIYIPLEEGMPVNRIQYILENSNTKLVLISKDNHEIKFAKEYIYVCPDVYQTLSKELTKTKAEKLRKEDGAYIIYTSGTTGMPKGVQINHGSVINLVEGLHHTIFPKFTQDNCFGLLSSFCFDASIQGIFSSLLLGIRLFIFSRQQRLDKEEMLRIIEREHISILDGTPMDLRMMLYCKNHNLKSIRYLLIGGETLYKSIVKEFYNTFEGTYQIINVYGPTECTVDATYLPINKELQEGWGEVIPIGYPLPNKRIYVLGHQLELLPEEGLGEIYISGIGGMDGYIGCNELTKKCFCPDILYQGERMYKTGDLGYFNQYGQVVYVGRCDHQVKVDGYRIETGEIEEVLRYHPKIKDCVVVLNEKGQHRLLCCYYVSNIEMSQGFEKELIDFLGEYVPFYMIPKKFVSISEIPLTVNGKIDYKILKTKTEVIQRSYEQPRDETENKILCCLKEVIGCEDIGINENFFQVGGNSIKGLQFMSLLETQGIRANLIDLFTHQTIREFYDFIKEQNKQIKSFVEAEKSLQKAFGGIYRYESISFDNKTYIVLCHPEGEDREILKEFMLKHFHKFVFPHYLCSEKEAESFEHICQSTSSDASAILKEKYRALKTGWNCYEEAITSEPIEEIYPANILQIIMMEFGFENSGTNIVLERPIQIERLQKAFHLVTTRHPLLRSEISYEGGQYTIVQHRNTNTADLPVIDLTSLPLRYKENIVIKLINQLYYDKPNKLQGLMYQAYLLKINDKQYILAFPAHHCIFDGISGEVIKKDLLQAYDTLEANEVLPYKKYTELMQLSERVWTEEMIKKQFELDLFDEFFTDKEFEPESYSMFEQEIMYKDMGEQPWNLLLSFIKDVLKDVFVEEKIPFYVLNYGRHYKAYDFFDMVGPFIDFIPCVLKKADTMEELDERIKKHIRMAEEMNINFMLSVYQQKKKYFLNHPLIVFNFQGEVEKESYNIRTQLDKSSVEGIVIEKSKLTGIYIEAYYTVNRLHVLVESTIKGMDISQVCLKRYEEMSLATKS